ncbi:TolC family protein [bacterium]|nr:TolC family protein [candidate division CSSED10-310 bacterium]
MNRGLAVGIVLILGVEAAGVAETFGLAECIVQARRNNPELEAMVQAVAQARARVTVAEAEAGISLDLSGWARIVSVVPEMIQPDVEVPIPGYEVTIPGSSFKLGDYDSYSIDLEISKVLYAGGRLEGAAVQADLAADALEVEQNLVRNRLDLEVGILGIGLTRLVELRRVAADALALSALHAEDIRNLKTAGVITDNEVLKADLRVSETETALIELTHQIELHSERLAAVTGCRFEMPGELPELRLGDPDIPDRSEGLSEALAGRIELESVDRRILSAEHRREMILREKRPVVTAFGKASFGKPGPDFIRNEWIDSYHAGIQCAVNLWDDGRIDSRAEEIRHELTRLAASRRAVESMIELDVIGAILRIKDASLRIDVAERALLQAEENFRLTRDRFSEGTLTNTDFLDAELALSRSRSNRVIARTDLNLAWVMYFAATGRDILEEVES